MLGKTFVNMTQDSYCWQRLNEFLSNWTCSYVCTVRERDDMDSVRDVVTTEWTGFCSRQGKEILHSSKRFRTDMGHTQPPTPWVQGINGTRFEAGHSSPIASRLGRRGAIPLLTFSVFMTFIWTTIIIFMERHIAFNYAVNCYDYIIIIIIGSTDLGRP